MREDNEDVRSATPMQQADLQARGPVVVRERELPPARGPGPARARCVPRCAAALAALLAVTCAAPGTQRATGGPPRLGSDRGRELFLRHCAACHGGDGEANTVIAGYLLPRPRAFGQGMFELARTDNGMPTIDDLVHTLQHGMPGSVMMAWDWLPEDDLRALAGEVRRLAVAGRARSIRDTAAAAGQAVGEAAAVAAAERQLAAGAAIQPVAPAEPTAAVLAAGERLFGRHCAACHGPDGRGLPAVRRWGEATELLGPRDFAAGYLRGGDSPEELSWRILAGMPGAHMPPTPLERGETAALLAYVQRLIPAGAGDRHRQWRRSAQVPRLAALPAADDQQSWQRLAAVRLPLAPLHWRPKAATEVWLRAAHDGREIALQLQWRDDTRSDRALTGAGTMGDGVALQFTAAPDPPLFAMGSAAKPVNVWRWQAFDPRETAGVVDLLTSPVHQGLDARSGVRPAPRSESIELGGVRSVGKEAGNGLPLAVHTAYGDGTWTVTFRRQLAARAASEIDLHAGEPLLVAIAVWNGAIDMHAGSKAITTWHRLQLAP